MEADDHTGGDESLTTQKPVPRSRGNDPAVEGQSSGSENAQATSSDAGPAMFDSATNTMITGGHFIARQGDHTNVTININDSHTPRSSGALVQIETHSSAQNVAPNPNRNPNRNRRRRRPNNPESNMIRPVQRSNEIYERHLMLKGRGFPLWIPQSNIRLPILYRAKGVCIGDVGIVTAFGGFDFLFNICRARDDPINPEELPDNFVPIHPPLNPTDVREFREFNSGSYLASSSIVESQAGEQTPGLTFESSASEGAILTMPDGAFHEELGNLSKFRDYVAIHATNWYKFVNGPRGREARNGDVRVVVGCDKTTAWGMATFSNSSSTQQSNFRLTFRPSRGQQQLQHSAGSAYAWEHSGVAEVRVGPEPGENEELGETPTSRLRNQCLFMRTLSVTLSDSVWAEAFPDTISAISQEGSQPGSRGQYLRPPNQNPENSGSSSSSSSNPTKSVRGKRRSGSLESLESEVVEESEDITDQEGSRQEFHGQYIGPSKPNTGKPDSSASEPATPVQDRRKSRSLRPSESEVGDDEEIQDIPRSSARLSSGDHITPEKPFVPTFVDKLYHMTNDPETAKCMTWTDSGASFIVWNVQMFAEFMRPYFHHTNFSSFVRQLNMYDFHAISRISPFNQDQAWEFAHPNFIRGRPDLLHGIKRKALELHGNPMMKDKVESFGDATQSVQTWDNPSTIINRYLLDQVPYAKIALTHDRDWSHIAMMGFSYLDPSKLIKEVTFVNDITVDSVSGIVFLEPKNKISPITDEEQSIVDQIEMGQISLEQYLFGSSKNYSTLLREVINELRSDYMPFCDQYTIPATGTLTFLKGHPKRLLSLDDLLNIRVGNLESLREHHSIHRVRSQMNALPSQHPNKGLWLLRLADILSRRFWHSNLKDDLEEAIWYYQEALSLLPQTDYHFLETILGLCSSVYQRFQLLGHCDDLKKLLGHLFTEHNLDLESHLTPIKTLLHPRQRIPGLDSIRDKTKMIELLNNLDEEPAENFGNSTPPSSLDTQMVAKAVKYQRSSSIRKMADDNV